MDRLSPEQDLLGTRNDLCVRLARSEREVATAQELRFSVFYEELKASPDTAASHSRRDADRFDAFCDHLIVVRRTAGNEAGKFGVDDGEMVGTYRLLRQSVAEQNGGFYTQSEFDIAPLLAAKPALKFLELGRSCVLKQYRTKPVVELLWQGIWNYVRHHGMDVMLGCASLEGTDHRVHAPVLDFLARTCAAPPEWRVRAVSEVQIEMNSSAHAPIDGKAALKALPPLIKGYLRLGCFIGDGAVIDRQFNTTDVLIILPVSNINPRYFAHFGQPDETVTY
ncbi:MAG TPA: GNAT family N-acyltransferase [Aestuariivirga sp.]|nr:GNAT family N-acyltransferase [Aestuariivirga sp.]